MRLTEDPLVDHLQGTGHGDGAHGGEDQGCHYGGGGMGRGGPEELAHDESALTVEADIPAQIGVGTTNGHHAADPAELLNGHRGATLTVRAGAVTVTGPQAALVSNNAYEMNDVAGLGHRARLDAGTLGVVGLATGMPEIRIEAN
jgi:hypothetical protein